MRVIVEAKIVWYLCLAISLATVLTSHINIGILWQFDSLIEECVRTDSCPTFSLHRLNTATCCCDLFPSSALPSPHLQVAQQLQAHCDSSITLKLNVVEARRRLEGKETSDLLRSVKLKQ